MPISDEVLEANSVDETDEELNLDNLDEAIAKLAAKADAPQEAAKEEPAKQDDEDDEAGDHDRKAGRYIPRHRYQYQRQQRELAERKAAEYAQQLQSLQQQMQAQQQKAQRPGIEAYEARLSELDGQIEDARADGDSKRVAQLRSEQRYLERQALTLALPETPRVNEQQLLQRATDSLKLEGTIDRLEQMFPMLEEGNKHFDAEVSDEVMTLYDSLIGKMPAYQAMERAVAYVTRAHNINPVEGMAKRGTNVARNVRAAAAQPPDLTGVGYDSNKAGVTQKYDIMKMTQDEFERLDEKEVEKLLMA